MHLYYVYILPPNIFRALVHIVDQTTFVVFCFLVRGMEAIGASAFTTASYVFVAQIFPDNIGAVMVR